MPELNTDSEGKKSWVAVGAAGRTGPGPRSPRRLCFASEVPVSSHTLSVPFNLGLQFHPVPLTRNDRSENDLDSFAVGVTSVEHGWIDDRELSHRYAERAHLKRIWLK
jgi:hypothetical protein